MKAPVSTSVAIGVGLVVLLGYFFPRGSLLSLRATLLEWGVILASVALLVGITNLLAVHWRKLKAAQPSSIYSLVLILSIGVTMIVAGWFGPTHSYSLWIFNYIQVPLESSLMAILAVILVYTIVRLIRRRANLLSIVFVASALVAMLGTTSPFGFDLPALSEFRVWVMQVPAMAGARGILIGVALGIVATGLRILTGAERPYGG